MDDRLRRQVYPIMTGDMFVAVDSHWNKAGVEYPVPLVVQEIGAEAGPGYRAALHITRPGVIILSYEEGTILKVKICVDNSVCQTVCQPRLVAWESGAVPFRYGRISSRNVATFIRFLATSASWRKLHGLMSFYCNKPGQSTSLALPLLCDLQTPLPPDEHAPLFV